MQEILDIINSIATTDFMKNFQYIQDKQNFKDVKYKEILEQWYLYHEIRILDNYENIKKNIKNDKKFLRILNKTPFDNKGKYNMDKQNI
jgi:hypothetical protein